MVRFSAGQLVGPALFLASGLLVATAGGVAGQPGKDKEPGKEKKDKGPKDKLDKGTKELRKAFDGITEAAQATPASKETTRLLDHAKTFYRSAVKAFPDEPRRAGELAVAANDAVRGLEHQRRASFQIVQGLPEPPAEFDGPPPPKDGPKGKDFKDDGPKGKGTPPPPKDGLKGKDFAEPSAERGPWSEAFDTLSRVQEWLATGEIPAKGPGRDFFDAAKGVVHQARSAYEAGEYRKAAELARAADAWLHVSEHLTRAEWDGPGAPPLAPEPEKKGAPPLPPSKD